MPDFNRVILMGRLTKDPELRYTPQGTAVCDVDMAVNRKSKNQDGSMREEVTFVNVTCWGRTAEVVCEYMKKGRPLFVEGRLHLDRWQDQQTGQNRQKLKVVAERIQFVDSKRDSQQGGSQDQGGGDQAYDDSGVPSEGSDVPF